jgi:hypothetical protein
MNTNFKEFSTPSELAIFEHIMGVEFGEDTKFPPDVKAITVCFINEADQINDEKIVYGGAKFIGLSYCSDDDEFFALEGRTIALQRAVEAMIEISANVPTNILDQLAEYSVRLSKVKKNVENAKVAAEAKLRKKKVSKAASLLADLGIRVPNALAAENDA